MCSIWEHHLTTLHLLPDDMLSKDCMSQFEEGEGPVDMHLVYPVSNIHSLHDMRNM
jgi:hypothetical protein